MKALDDLNEDFNALEIKALLAPLILYRSRQLKQKVTADEIINILDITMQEFHQKQKLLQKRGLISRNLSSEVPFTNYIQSIEKENWYKFERLVRRIVSFTKEHRTYPNIEDVRPEEIEYLYQGSFDTFIYDHPTNYRSFDDLINYIDNNPEIQMVPA